MLTLTLLRHAKSSWDDFDLDDFDRPLAPRGIKAAPMIAAAIAEHGPDIDLILSSPSVRTRQTLELALPKFGVTSPPVQFIDGLYHAYPEFILDTVRKKDKDARHILVVGHNPGLESLADQLTRTGPRQAIELMARKFPTAAAAQFTFDDTTWAAVKQHSGELVYFLTPRTLS